MRNTQIDAQFSNGECVLEMVIKEILITAQSGARSLSEFCSFGAHVFKVLPDSLKTVSEAVL